MTRLAGRATLGGVSSFFEPRAQSDVWFRIGRVQVTSTLAVVLIGLLGSLAWIFYPPLPQHLALLVEPLFRGEIWRLVAWPLAGSLDIWALLTLLMLWLFGTQLENAVGRDRMAQLYLGIGVVLTVTTVVVGLLLPGSTFLAGLRMLQFCILLLFIAENPRQPFFFGIPAWVLGVVLLALEILQLVAARAGGTLLALLLSLAGVAVVARRAGLLSSYDWLPGSGGRVRTSRRHTPRPAAPKAPTRNERRAASDEERLDELLGKISAHGIHSLTKSERAELDKIRERRRR